GVPANTLSRLSRVTLNFSCGTIPIVVATDSGTTVSSSHQASLWTRRRLRVGGHPAALRGSHVIQCPERTLDDKRIAPGHDSGAWRADSTPGNHWPMPAEKSDALDHVVVVLFENRSLDNVLGRLY